MKDVSKGFGFSILNVTFWTFKLFKAKYLLFESYVSGIDVLLHVALVTNQSLFTIQSIIGYFYFLVNV